MKICIVDDELAVRSGVIFKLNSLQKPIEVFDAGYGQAALEKVRSVRPDVVIMDIMMPGLDGLELLRILKEERPSVRVYLLTGYSEFEYARKAIELGSMGYLLKPANKEELLKLVTAVEREEKNKLEEDFRQYGVQLRERGIYLDQMETDLPFRWYDETIPKRIMLASGPDLLWTEQASAIVTFQLRQQLYGAVVSSDWSKNGCFANGEQFIPALLQSVEAWDTNLFFEGTALAGTKGGEAQLKRSAAMRQEILQAVKELNVPRLEQALHPFLDLAGSLELKQLRKECTYLMAALDETMTAGHQISIVEEDKLAYWTSWVHRYPSWRDLRRSVEKFVGGGTRALAELESVPLPVDLAEKAIQLVKKSKGATISLEAVASALSVHAVTLSRIFKQQTGENFVRYAVRQKMKQAEKLLTETDMKMGEIAEHAGYADYKYFSQLFKQTYGMSPALYRKTHGRPER